MAKMMNDRAQRMMIASLLDQMPQQGMEVSGKQQRIRDKIMSTGEDPDGSDDPKNTHSIKRENNVIDGPGRTPRDSDTFDDSSERSMSPFDAKPSVHRAPTARGPYPSTSLYHHEPYPGLLDIRNYTDEHEPEEERRMVYPEPQFDESTDPAYAAERENYKNRKHELNPKELQGPAPPASPEDMGYNGKYSQNEPTVPVPASLAHAGMQALMSQASGGRSLGADGQLAGNLMSDEDMNNEMGMAPNVQNPANRVDPQNLPPVEDPEQVEMIRRGRERRGRSA